MGWLQARPEIEVGKGKTEPHELTRAEQFVRAGKELPMPPIEGGYYLMEILMDCGAVRYDQMGNATPLDWQELSAYCGLAQRDIETWEARALRDMSASFVRGMNEGKNIFSIMPIERNA
jgi:hypothetical protein